MKKPRREDYETQGVYLHNLAEFWNQKADWWGRVATVLWTIAGVAWIVSMGLFVLQMMGVVG